VNPEDRASLNSLDHEVVGPADEVSNILGAGFLEKVYGRVLLSELALPGVPAKTQVSHPVSYKDQLC
jgi:GxxExxY protein